jgi:hypothetical protein
MESVKTRELSAALTLAKKAVTLKAGVTGSLWLSRYGLTAHGLEGTLEVSFSRDLEGMPANGAVQVEPANLVKALKEWKPADSPTVTVQDGTVCTAGVTLPAPAPEDRPEVSLPLEYRGTVAADSLAGVAGFAAADDMRPILAGVRFETGELIATDSYRLGIVGDVALEVPEGFTVPAAACKVIAGVPDGGMVMVHDCGAGWVALVADSKHGSTVRFTVPTVEGQFPEYRKIMPEAGDWQLEAPLEVDAAVSQLEKLERWHDGKAPALLEVNGTVEVSLEVRDGATVAPASVSGPVRRVNGAGPETVRVGVNPGFLKAAVGFLESPTLKVVGPLKPMALEGGARSVLVMPIRLED